jgi:hypothetical protein
MAQAMAALQRAKFIFLNPSSCWNSLAAEPTTVKDLYLKYAMFLAVSPAVCGLIGMSLIGAQIPFLGTWRTPFFSTLVYQVVAYGMGLAALFVSTLVIQKISPRFGGSSDLTASAKLVIYSVTPIWLAGVLQLIPLLSILGLGFLCYSVYLFSQGPTKVLAVPEEKRLNFTVISIIALIVVQIVIGILVAIASPTPPLPNMQGMPAIPGMTAQ